jgi:nucleolar complex protein 3
VSITISFVLHILYNNKFCLNIVLITISFVFDIHRKVCNDGFNKSTKRTCSDDEEADFEKRPRVFKEDQQSDRKREIVVERLPIKAANGQWERRREVVDTTDIVEDSASDESVEYESFDQEPGEDAEERKEELKEPLSDRRARALASPQEMVMISEDIASIASAIIGDPDENIGKLKLLRKWNSDFDGRVLQLAFLTQVTVYKNIIPGYRIRELSEKEKTTRVCLHGLL